MVAPSLLVAISLAIAALVVSGIHKVNEGEVGVYWRGGALLFGNTYPGYHWKLPITTFATVQITMQTDEVKDIPCGTSGGVMLYFDKIEVVNRLKTEYVHDTIKNYTVNYDQTWVFDKIHHSINEFCSKATLHEVYIEKFEQLDEALSLNLQQSCDEWAPGIEIIAIRVTKPRIPVKVQAAYEDMESEKTKLLIARQKQKVVQKEAETDKKQAVIQAQKALAVSKIMMQKEVAEKRGEAAVSKIEDEIHLARAKSEADSQFYTAEMQARSNSYLLTEGYLYLHKLESLSTNAQLVYGSDIPQSLLSQSSLGYAGGL